MCEVCDKVNFAIETIESLINIDDLMGVFYRTLEKEKEVPFEQFKRDRVNILSARTNFMAMVMASYLAKHKVPLFPAMSVIGNIMAYTYEHGPIEGTELQQKLRDYES